MMVTLWSLMASSPGDDLHEGVSGFVICDDLFVVIGHGAAGFAAPVDLVAGLVEVGHCDGRAAMAGGVNGALVEKIREIGAGVAGGGLGDFVEVDGGVEFYGTGVDLEDGDAAREIGKADGNLAIETTGAEERAVHRVRAVGGAEDDDGVVGLEAVHFDEERVEGLVVFLLGPGGVAAGALAADGVDFVDEDDARRGLAGFLEERADARGADADIHFDEVGAAEAVEFGFRFAGDGLGEHGFAGARRTDEENALRHAAAGFAEAGGIAEKFDDLVDLVLGFVAAGDGGKFHGGGGGTETLPGEAGEAAAVALEDDDETEDERDDREGRRGGVGDFRGALDGGERLGGDEGGGVVFDEVVRAQGGEVGIGEAAGAAEGAGGVAVGERRRNIGEAEGVAAIDDVAGGELAGLGGGEEFGERDAFGFGAPGDGGGALGQGEIEAECDDENGEQHEEPTDGQHGHSSYAADRGISDNRRVHAPRRRRGG